MKTENEKQENTTLEYLFQEQEVHFLIHPTDKNVMINATEMAKMFDRRTKDYLKSKATKELILELERAPNGARSDQKVVENRGHVGIYFCEILALDFAAWLDVKFRIWIYNTIREIITKETSHVKTAVSTLTEKETALQKIISNIHSSENAEAKSLLNAISEFETAKKNKSKAVTLFSKQMSMDL